MGVGSSNLLRSTIAAGSQGRTPAFMYFVYILHCPVTELSYVGQTDNLILRYYRHRNGDSRWTRRMQSPIVVHWEAFCTRSQAMKREKYYKQGSGARVKAEIIAAFLTDTADGHAARQDSSVG